MTNVRKFLLHRILYRTERTLNIIDSHKQPRQSLTLAQYVEWRNGVPLGDANSMRNMLHRSLGASSFARFWQYWNPIWGYGLGKYVYAPLARFLPAAIALIATFIVSGGLHDLATMAVRRSIAFLFTPWFFLLGIGVVLGHLVNMDLSNQAWLVRASVNLTYLIICLLLTLLLKRILAIP